jgi:tetratricopeptide (TPR) repeat protein
MTMKQIAQGLAFGLVVLCLSSAESEAQQQRVRPEECTRELARSTLESRSWEDVAAQRAIAETCAGVGATARGVQAARARFYSGRAYNRLPGQGDEAIRQLEIAVNSGQDFENQFARELRAARLELVQAYRAGGRLEAARNLLASSALRPSDPAVAYQRSMLILAELREAGRESAFEVLRGVFVQDDAQLLGSTSDPTGLTRAEIRRGRSWLYWLGMSLGQEALAQGGQNDDQRRADALRAINYFGPVASAIATACPDPEPINCGNGIGETEQIGSLGYPRRPTADQLLSASFQLGVAHLKAAGVRETSGLTSIAGDVAVGEAGALDCFSANIAADAGSHFQNARYAFETVTRRSPQGAGAAANARWGLGCAILANVNRIADPGEQQRQLAQAVEQLRQAPDRPLTLLTLARAQVLQGQLEGARANYQRALAMAGPDTQCYPDRQPNANARAELPSRIYLELARTRFSEPLSGARRSGSDLFARTITEVASARPQALLEAESELQCAIALNYHNSEARLTLGHIYLRLGSDGELDPPPFSRALQALRYFERPIGSGQEGRAEGLYLLSRRETMLQQNRLVRGNAGTAGNGANAVGYATQAYNTVQRPEFRRQACMAQMLFGNTREEGYCSASGQGDERAESLLYEGMYWLRRGQRERETRMSSWSRSIQAFNRGLADSSAGVAVDSVHPSLPPQIGLQDLLYYGERYVLRCARLDYGDRETASEEVRTFFRLSGMPDPCGGAPR